MMSKKDIKTKAIEMMETASDNVLTAYYGKNEFCNHEQAMAMLEGVQNTVIALGVLTMEETEKIKDERGEKFHELHPELRPY